MLARRTSLAALALAVLIAVAPLGIAPAEADTCTNAVLNGLYVLTATGFIIPATGPAQPKTLIELIRFNGGGTQSAPAAARSLNGVFAEFFPGSSGTYAVVDMAGEKGCGRPSRSEAR